MHSIHPAGSTDPIYTCVACGPIFCDECYTQLGGTGASCPTCKCALGACRNRVVERVRDTHLKKMKAAATASTAQATAASESAFRTSDLPAWDRPAYSRTPLTKQQDMKQEVVQETGEMGIVINDSMHQALAVVKSPHDEVLISEEQPRNSNDEERKMKFERFVRGREAERRGIRKNMEGDKAWEERKLETTTASQQSNKGHTPRSMPVCTMVGHNRGKESAAAKSKTKRSKQSHCESANGGGSIETSCIRIRVADSPPHTSDKATTSVLRPVKKPLKASKLCEHQRQRSRCIDCGGSSICDNQRRISECKACGGSEICKHERVRRRCKACSTSNICEHQRHRRSCKDCQEAQATASAPHTADLLARSDVPAHLRVLVTQLQEMKQEVEQQQEEEVGGEKHDRRERCTRGREVETGGMTRNRDMGGDRAWEDET